MKYTLLLAVLIVSMVSCHHPMAPAIKFNKDTLNFGSISKGDSTTVQFWFTNDGGSDLQVINVGTTCNCSAANFPRTPFGSGKKGCITIKYVNSLDSQVGAISKTVVVETNCKPAVHVLTLMGTVNPNNNSSL